MRQNLALQLRRMEEEVLQGGAAPGLTARMHSAGERLSMHLARADVVTSLKCAPSASSNARGEGPA